MTAFGNKAQLLRSQRRDVSLEFVDEFQTLEGVRVQKSRFLCWQFVFRPFLWEDIV